MPKKKTRNKRTMRPIAQKYPSITIRMALEQVVGMDKVKNDFLVQEIEDALRTAPPESVHQDIESLIKSVYATDSLSAAATATAILKALGR